MVRIHSPRPNSSKTYRHSHLKSGSKKGPFLDPTLTRTFALRWPLSPYFDQLAVRRLRRPLGPGPGGLADARDVPVGRRLNPHFETVTSTVFDLIRTALSGSG